MIQLTTVNICQPGFGASCSLCCGSHNFSSSPENAAALYRLRTVAGEEMSLAPLQADAIQCAHVGFIDDECTLIGCLIYRRSPDENAANRFFTYTCKNFSCAAREMLTDEQILFAAQLMGDWYYYSLFITDIPVIQAFTREYKTARKVPAPVLAGLKLQLREMIGASVHS